MWSSTDVRALRLFFGLSVCLSVCLSIVALSMHRCLGFRDFFSSFSAPAQQTRLVLSGLRGSCRKSPLHTVTRRESRKQGEREGDTLRERDLGTDAHKQRRTDGQKDSHAHVHARARAHTHTHTGKCDKSFAQGKARDPWPLPLHGASELRLAIARGSCAGS